MNVLAWLFIGVIGAGATYLSLTTGNDQLAILTGLIGTVSWLLFAFLSLEVVEVSSGVQVTSRYPAMAAWGLAMAAPNFYIALTGPLFELERQFDDIREEVQ